MTVLVRNGRAQRRAAAPRARALRGYAKSRQAYDARRRARPFSAESRDYAAMLRTDPCSYCGEFCSQMAADHIVPLEAGGENDWSNLTAAGRRCNASKKAKPLLLWMLTR